MNTETTNETDPTKIIHSQGMFNDRVPWRLFLDGRLQFHKREDDGAGWSCYPSCHIDEFWTCLKSKMKGGWMTPWDAQETACRTGLATYSKRNYRKEAA